MAREGGRMGAEAVHCRADHRQAQGGRDRASERGQDTGGMPQAGNQREHVLPVAQGVRWTEGGSGTATQGAGAGKRPAQEVAGGDDARQRHPQRGFVGKLLSPARRSRAVHHAQQSLGVSERRACRVLGQVRSTQQYRPKVPQEEKALVERMTQLATQYGRYGYRRITALLVREGWRVNHKRVERLWRREGLKVPKKQPKRGRWWRNDGSCVRLRPERKDHVWAYDFVHERTHDGRAFRLLTIVDEYTRECLAIDVARRLNSEKAARVICKCCGSVDLFRRRLR